MDIVPGSAQGVINPSPMVHQCWQPDFLKRGSTGVQPPQVEPVKGKKGEEGDKPNFFSEVGQAVTEGALLPNVKFKQPTRKDRGFVNVSGRSRGAW